MKDAEEKKIWFQPLFILVIFGCVLHKYQLSQMTPLFVLSKEIEKTVFLPTFEGPA